MRKMNRAGTQVNSYANSPKLQIEIADSKQSPRNMFKSPNNRNLGFNLPGISETPQVNGGQGFFMTDVEMAVPTHARSP